MRLAEQRVVARPQAEVFDYTADFSNLASWDPGIVASHKIDDGPVGLGTRFRVEVKLGARTTPMIYEMTEFEAPNRIVIVGKGSVLDAVDEITFTDTGDSTVIEYTADLTFKGSMRFLAPFARRSIRRVGKKALDGLAAALA